MDINSPIPQGEEFSPFLKAFMAKHTIATQDLATAFDCSVYTIERLMSGESLPTERTHAELTSAFVIIEGKDKKAYFNLSPDDRRKVADALIATGGSTLTIAATIPLISSLGVVSGLSAAGITSGLVAIGGTMLGGILVVAAAPLLIGAGIYYLLGRKRKSLPDTLFLFKDSLNPIFEIARPSLPLGAVQ